MTKTRTWPSRLAALGAVAATAASGTASTTAGSDWYLGLEKPAWQPPKWAFPVVWTALYADIALVSGQVLAQTKKQGRDEEHDQFARSLAVNLVLNAAWSQVFFRFHRMGAAAAVAAALALSSSRLARQAGAQDEKLGLALKPYAAWTAFASALSTDIWRRNRD